MGSDTRKVGMMIRLLKRGVPEDQVGAPVMALMPLDDQVQPSRAFEKAARKLSKNFAKSVRKATPEEIVPMATATLTEIRQLAIDMGEPYYSDRYDVALGLEPGEDS